MYFFLNNEGVLIQSASNIRFVSAKRDQHEDNKRNRPDILRNDKVIPNANEMWKSRFQFFQNVIYYRFPFD